MSQTSKMKLMPSSIINVPFQSYSNDFVFIINGEEFRTCKLISDLLSPNICKIHSNDPTFDVFEMNTRNHGNFAHILNLIKFNEVQIPEEEFPFIIEVINVLGSKCIEFLDQIVPAEITIDNVFKLIENHRKYDTFYSKSISEEIEFIAQHFYELCETHKKEFLKLDINMLIAIVNHSKIQLYSEDQLMSFVNDLYSIDGQYSILYESVHFLNVSSNTISDFVEIYDFNKMTASIWMKISSRLEQRIKSKEEERTSKKRRYKEKPLPGIQFSLDDQNPFNGIFNFLKRKSSDKIEAEVDITASSCYSDNADWCQPKNVVLFDDLYKCYESKNLPNSWISFDFKEKRVIPTNYTIRSRDIDSNFIHPKSWVIEGSIDNESWTILDRQNNCSRLNGKSLIYTFSLSNQQFVEFRYIRMRAVSPSWHGSNYFAINSFEIYGRLI
ncbi:hypothetical protein M9Y10_007265 [Tritrichomonas musculus]|uniref:F5/8 type C domain-containing protein n=1 Tax=Tritrichomonas musculus TaxID=1915356 RepID=A0ABR2J0Y4_9EUKA